MLFETLKAIDKVTDYTKREDGSWRADISGTIEAHAEGRSLNECRDRLLDVIDARVAELIAANQAAK